MTPDDAPATGHRTALTLDDGPLHDALAAVDRAVSDIEHAKGTLTARRHDFAAVFRAEMTARADDTDAFVDELRGVIRALYWDHPTLRMTDLSAATGLDNDRIRRVAGPRLVQAACTACGAPTEVLQTRRSERVPARCADCRGPEPATVPGADPWGPRGPAEPPRLSGPAWLGQLVAHLDARLRTVECDNQLTLTRRWALREGLDQQAVVAQVERLGGFCDCEVVVNA